MGMFVGLSHTAYRTVKNRWTRVCCSAGIGLSSPSPTDLGHNDSLPMDSESKASGEDMYNAHAHASSRQESDEMPHNTPNHKDR